MMKLLEIHITRWKMKMNRDHNLPPDLILKNELDNILPELENWQDGTPVSNDGQLSACEKLIDAVKDIERRAKVEKEVQYRPIKIQSDAVTAKWSPLLKDLEDHKRGLLKLIEAYKIIKYEEKKRLERAAWEKANEAKRDAEIALMSTDMANINDRRTADEADLLARQLEMEARLIRQDGVKGLRTKTTVVVNDWKRFVYWLSQNDQEGLNEILTTYAQKIGRDAKSKIDGLEIVKEKIAF